MIKFIYEPGERRGDVGGGGVRCQDVDSGGHKLEDVQEEGLVGG